MRVDHGDHYHWRCILVRCGAYLHNGPAISVTSNMRKSLLFPLDYTYLKIEDGPTVYISAHAGFPSRAAEAANTNLTPTDIDEEWCRFNSSAKRRWSSPCWILDASAWRKSDGPKNEGVHIHITQAHSVCTALYFRTGNRFRSLLISRMLGYLMSIFILLFLTYSYISWSSVLVINNL